MTTKAAPRLTIGQILEPKTVAVFGASDDLGKWGGRIMHYLTLHGYSGTVIPINPRRQVVRGHKCFPRITDAPPVDVAIIAVPAGAVAQTLRECETAGVGCCVIITAGFTEAGADGAAMQAEIEAIAARSGMRLVGPNCLGLINYRNGMALTSARVLDVDKVHVGEIGLVSQSGALMLSVYNRAHDQEIGFSQIISVGNQADLEVCDFFEHMIGAADTRVICLHIEGLRDGPRYLDLLRRARDVGKPVIVLKTGRSEEGGRAAQSHTASLAGSYAVFEAASREAGAILVDDPDVMVLLADFLRRYPAGKHARIGILSPSGGMNGVVLDRMADSGLSLAKFAAGTLAEVGKYILPGQSHNPVDLGARRHDVGEAVSIAEPIAKAVGDDPNVGVILIPLTTIPNYETAVTGIANGLVAAGKPALFAITPGSVATGVRKILREKGLAYCDRIDDAMRVLKAYAEACAASPTGIRPVVPAYGGTSLPSGYLSEPAAKALLAGAGVRVSHEVRVATAVEAKAAAEKIGYPVVLKGVSDKIVHKSDAGIVKLGLADAAAVIAAFDEVDAKVRAVDPAAEGCVVAEHVRAELELIVGVKLDPQFGPSVLVGAGGVLVELLQDVQVGLAPVTPDAARAMLRRLRVWPLLEGYRGQPALDVEAVVDTLVRVSVLAASLGTRLVELDINPLMVRRKGAVAVDARAVIA